MSVDASYRLEKVAVAGKPVLPVAVAEFKQYAKVEHDDEPHVIETAILAAASWLEDATGLVFLSREYILKLEEFGLCMYIPRWPIQSIDAVKYVNTSGTVTTLASNQYQTDVATHPVIVVPAVNVSWPATQTGVLNPVRVEFTAGWGDAADSIPFLARQAICLLARHLYDTRSMPGGEIPPAIMRVIDPLVMNGVVA